MTIKDVSNVLARYDEIEVECLRKGYSVKRGKNSLVSLKTRKPRKRYIGLTKEIVDEPEKTVIEYHNLVNFNKLERELNNKK